MMMWSSQRGCILPTVKDDPEALAMFREAMKQVNQHDKPTNIVSTHECRNTEHGNSRAYSIDRVKRECDEETGIDRTCHSSC